MPSVDVAMARSLRGGLWGTFAESLAANIARRNTFEDIQNGASDAKTAFSSWDNCMEASFCKWPVIAIIIVGGLIIFSIVWCIARCLCCGLSCCCECCYCLKCCGNCLGCCDPPKGRAHKYLDNETLPPNHGYRPEPPMKAPAFSPVRTGPGPVYEPPQYAEFDMSKKGGEDSLPSMPTWNDAGSKKVVLEEEAVEMNQLNRTATGQQTVASASAAAAASAAAVAAAASQPSPSMSGGNRSPYRQPSPAGPNGYPAQAAGYGNQPRGQNYNNGYSQPASPYGADPYVAGAIAPASRMASPHQDYNNGYSQGYSNNNNNNTNQGYANDQGYGQDQGYGNGYDNGHSAQGYGADYAHPSQAAQAYGLDARRPSPAPAAYAAEPLRHSPAPQAGYGYGQQQQQSQQYGAGAGYRQPQVQQQPSLQNVGGFDFNSGYSRPQEYNDYRQPSPIQTQQPQELPANTFTAYSPNTAQRNNGY